MSTVYDERECVCQCNNKECNNIFYFKNKNIRKYNHINDFVCPKCGHKFSVISLANKNDEEYLNSFLDRLSDSI